jgi:hypothetical protein
MTFSEFTAAVTADETEKDAEKYLARKYLAHRYEAPERRDFPLPDEDFVSEWDAWLRGRNGGFPEAIRALLSGESTKIWLEATPAGSIPVVCTEDRRAFERLTAILRAADDSAPIPASVNAFIVPARHPLFKGHRVICMAKAGYSALSGESAGIGDGEWVEKSAVIRLHHECCHYFTLRVLGGMKNHALDEVVADCAGQLAAFGRYDASLQRKFFGIEGGSRIAPEGRLSFYVKRLPEGAISLICRKVEEALDGLEGYLAKNSEMAETSRRPELIVKLAVLGLSGIARALEPL